MDPKRIPFVPGVVMLNNLEAVRRLVAPFPDDKDSREVYDAVVALMDRIEAKMVKPSEGLVGSQAPVEAV